MKPDQVPARAARLRRIAIVCCVFWGAALRAADELKGILVLEHATVIDGVSSEPLHDMTVVVKNGKIDQVSAAGKSAVPEGAQRLDVAGRWLMPGFIDAHMHPFMDVTARQGVALGVTTGRSMGTNRYADVALRDRHRKGENDLPEILAAGFIVVPNLTARHFGGGAIFNVLPQLSDLRSETDIGVEGVRRLVRANIERGVDLIKVVATDSGVSLDLQKQWLSNAELEAAVAEAHKAGVPVAVHAHGDGAAMAAVRAGAKTIEHGTYLSDATLQLMKSKNVFFTPTIAVTVRISRPDSREALAVVKQGLAPDAKAVAEQVEKNLLSVRDVVQRARKLGVKIIAGSDTSGGNPIAEEMFELVAAGLTPMEAIRAATSTCAEALGISSRTGSIRSGLEADLVVLRANPLADIKAVQDVMLVINDGDIVVNRTSEK